MTPTANTPIIVGAGQITERVPADLSMCSSHADLAAAASARALEDAFATPSSEAVDAIVCVRTFADSSDAFRCPFGSPDNFPRAVAQRLDAQVACAVYSTAGGHSPQSLVGEFAERLFRGEHRAVLLAGGEAIANTRAAVRAGTPLDWSEQIGGQLEDRGRSDGHALFCAEEIRHGVTIAAHYYGLIEQARRHALGEDRATYDRAMAECFAAMSAVAASNPHAMFPQRYSAEELLKVSDDNRMISLPYPRRLVAKDGVNQGAALLMTTVGVARELGIAEEKWVFLHGYAHTADKVLTRRPRLGESLAMGEALRGAVGAAGASTSALAYLDLYSCFPVVVLEARDALGIDVRDPRPLTQTGGLAFFGGAGNNYSMHAIAQMVPTLRADPGASGLVYANGGWMSKHAAGVYSASPPAQPWSPCDSSALQATVDAQTREVVDELPKGEACVESYIVTYDRSGDPSGSVVVGRLHESGRRFLAVNAPGDARTLAHTAEHDVLGQTVYVKDDPAGNRYAYSESDLARASRLRARKFQDSYEYCEVDRSDHILTVTIARPQVRNALHPAANQELEDIFDCYESDDELRVAILTGTGTESFSAGNDLKYMASGKSVWVPRSGFAGLTRRAARVKPVIAAVNGTALGGGLEIAMACDIIIAVEHAVFGLPEVKVGLFAGMGGVQRLTRQIGMKRAMEMLLTGASIDAREALSFGLINAVVPMDELAKAARKMAEAVARCSPLSIRCTMQLLNDTASFASVDEAVTQPNDLLDRLLNSEDMYEGMAAFAEKRSPRWRGR
ncbi:MAG: enoyl-CoA hydratase-related protein [Pseudomonadota bacterium]